MAKTKEESDRDNHAVQLNPTSDTYWTDRGYDERPDNWESIITEDEKAS
jgi:hypothetical protein